jgi:tetratricopeptide (TPR) repeat protein
LQKNPNDPALISRIGKALVQTHSYAKAIAHYEAALGGSHVAPSAQRHVMQYDLAALYFKLKRLDDSEQVLAQILEPSNGEEEGAGSEDTQAMMEVRISVCKLANW